MAVKLPVEVWRCLNEECHVTIFGSSKEFEGGSARPCPKCQFPSIPATHDEWVSSMIAGEWLGTPGLEFPRG